MEIKNVEGTSLYQRYPGQSEAQDCYVELDARGEGELCARTNPEIGNAIPFDVYHGHVQRWTISPLRADAANALLAKIEPLAERVVAGYGTRWDGNNQVADYDDDAAKAIDEIEELCDNAGGEGEDLEVWQASDWFDALGTREMQARELGITASTTDDELIAISLRAVADAENEGVDELEGLNEHLAALRAAVRYGS